MLRLQIVRRDEERAAGARAGEGEDQQKTSGDAEARQAGADHRIWIRGPSKDCSHSRARLRRRHAPHRGFGEPTPHLRASFYGTRLKRKCGPLDLLTSRPRLDAPCMRPFAANCSDP